MCVLIDADVPAQSTVPTLFAGYGVVGVVIGKSVDTQGITGSSQTFSGSGPLLGVGVQIGNRIFVDLNYQRAKGTSSENTLNNQYTYEIDGFQMPLNVNYLLRQRSRRFNVSVGAGLNVLKAHIQQWDKYGQHVIDKNILDPSMGWIVSARWRLIRNLEIGANLNFSVIGTYGISDSFMLRYTFKSSQESSN